MKFDLDTAWKEASALVRGNLKLLAVVAGVFYFIPYLAALLWIPGLGDILTGRMESDPSIMEAKVNAMMMDYWWALVLLGIVQGIGFLAMLALLRRRANPTVGQAIEAGAKSVASYLAATILLSFLIGLVVLVIVLPGAVLELAALNIVAIIAAFAAFFYLFTKFALIPPVIAIEGVLNPLHAMSRSWKLTKGNSLRLFFFFALLVIAYAVISAVVSLLFSLVFALGGTEAQLFGQAAASSVMNAAFAVLFAGVLAAVYAQLSRLRAPKTEAADKEY